MEDHYGVGPAITHDLPIVREYNAVIKGVLKMWEDRIQFLMACRNISLEEALEVLMGEIERGD